VRLKAVPAVTDRLLELPHPSFRNHGVISPVYFAELPELSPCVAGDTHSKITGERDLKTTFILVYHDRG